MYEEALEQLAAGPGRFLWWPPSKLLAFLRAWGAHARIEVKLGVFEMYLKVRGMLGLQRVDVSVV